MLQLSIYFIALTIISGSYLSHIITNLHKLKITIMHPKVVMALALTLTFSILTIVSLY